MNFKKIMTGAMALSLAALTTLSALPVQAAVSEMDPYPHIWNNEFSPVTGAENTLMGKALALEKKDKKKNIKVSYSLYDYDKDGVKELFYNQKTSKILMVYDCDTKSYKVRRAERFAGADYDSAMSKYAKVTAMNLTKAKLTKKANKALKALAKQFGSADNEDENFRAAYYDMDADGIKELFVRFSNMDLGIYRYDLSELSADQDIYLYISEPNYVLDASSDKQLVAFSSGGTGLGEYYVYGLRNGTFYIDGHYSYEVDTEGKVVKAEKDWDDSYSTSDMQKVLKKLSKLTQLDI